MNNSQQIIELEETLARAHVDEDWAKVDQLLHPDYIIVQPNGVLETKKEVLESYRSGMRIWKSASVDQISVTFYGNIARVIGRWTAVGSNNGSTFDYQARFISMWLKTSKLWQNIAYSSGEIKKKNEPIH